MTCFEMTEVPYYLQPHLFKYSRELTIVLSMHAFIHSRNIYWILYVSDTAQGAGDLIVNITKDLVSWNLHSRMGYIDK